MSDNKRKLAIGPGPLADAIARGDAEINVSGSKEVLTIRHRSRAPTKLLRLDQAPPPFVVQAPAAAMPDAQRDFRLVWFEEP
jgi:hypothetical protein